MQRFVDPKARFSLFFGALCLMIGRYGQRLALKDVLLTAVGLESMLASPINLPVWSTSSSTKGMKRRAQAEPVLRLTFSKISREWLRIVGSSAYAAMPHGRLTPAESRRDACGPSVAIHCQGDMDDSNTTNVGGSEYAYRYSL